MFLGNPVKAAGIVLTTAIGSIAIIVAEILICISIVISGSSSTRRTVGIASVHSLIAVGTPIWSVMTCISATRHIPVGIAIIVSIPICVIATLIVPILPLI